MTITDGVVQWLPDEAEKVRAMRRIFVQVYLEEVGKELSSISVDKILKGNIGLQMYYGHA